MAFSDLATDFAEQIDSIDINPLFVFPEGEGCAAVDALVVKTEQP